MIKLEDRVIEKREVDVEVRPALYANRCAACQRIFVMNEFCNDGQIALLSGTFDKCANDPETGKSKGNQLSVNVCSFRCADDLFARDGWESLPEYRPFVDVDAKLVRCMLTLTAYVDDEKTIRKKWAETKSEPIAYGSTPNAFGKIRLVPRDVVAIGGTGRINEEG